jgi:hypothetical protein
MDWLTVLVFVTQLYTISLLRGKENSPRKQKYNLMLRLKNLGDVEPIPAVNSQVEIKFASALLDLYRKNNQTPKITEGEWITTGKWKELGGGTPENYRRVMDKWSTERIVGRASQAKNAQNILLQGWVSKLKNKTSPALPQQDATPKQAEMRH